MVLIYFFYLNNEQKKYLKLLLISTVKDEYPIKRFKGKRRDNQIHLRTYVGNKIGEFRIVNQTFRHISPFICLYILRVHEVGYNLTVRLRNVGNILRVQGACIRPFICQFVVQHSTIIWAKKKKKKQR